MYPLHLDASFRIDDRDLSRAAAEHHLMLQDFRLDRPAASRRSRRAFAAWLRRRPAVGATPTTAPTSLTAAAAAGGRPSTGTQTKGSR